MEPTVYNSTSNPIVSMNFDCSTGHIEQNDAALLDCASNWKHQTDNPPIVYKYAEGYFVYVPDQADLEGDLTHFKSLGFSDAFLNLLRETARLKCKYLQLDADGMEYENLPTFEW